MSVETNIITVSKLLADKLRSWCRCCHRLIPEGNKALEIVHGDDEVEYNCQHCDTALWDKIRGEKGRDKVVA